MDAKVKAFLAQAQEKQARAEREERDRLLISLGLVQDGKTVARKEYLPEGTLAFQAEEQGYSESEEIDGLKRFYKWVECPVAVEVTDEEYKQILQVVEAKKAAEAKNLPAPASEKEKSDYELVVERNFGFGAAAALFRVLAIVCWLVGLVVAFFKGMWALDMGRVGIAFDYNFVEFFSVYINYLLYGGILYALSVVMSNTQGILSTLHGFSLKRK